MVAAESSDTFVPACSKHMFHQNYSTIRYAVITAPSIKREKRRVHTERDLYIQKETCTYRKRRVHTDSVHIESSDAFVIRVVCMYCTWCRAVSCTLPRMYDSIHECITRTYDARTYRSIHECIAMYWALNRP